MNASLDLGPRTSSIVAWIERAVGEGARVVGIGAMPRSSTEKHVVEVALGESWARFEGYVERLLAEWQR